MVNCDGIRERNPMLRHSVSDIRQLTGFASRLSLNCK